MTELFKNIESLQADKNKLRQNFRRMFWDVDTTKLDFEKHYKGIITQVLNYGYPEEIQALFGIYSKDIIKKVLGNPIKGVWFPKIYKAFCSLLDVKPQKKAINILFIERKTGKKIKGLFSYLLNPF